MIRRIIAIDPGLTGTGLVDLLLDRDQSTAGILAIVDVLAMDVIRPPAKGDYPARFDALYTGVLNWLDSRVPLRISEPNSRFGALIEQPTSDHGQRRKHGDVAVLGGAWACCCLAVAQRVNVEGIHMVPSGKWIPSRTRKATYLAIVEAAEKHDAQVQGREPFLTGQPEHLIACCGMAKWWALEQERAANLERARS